MCNIFDINCHLQIELYEIFRFTLRMFFFLWQLRLRKLRDWHFLKKHSQNLAH